MNKTAVDNSCTSLFADIYFHWVNKYLGMATERYVKLEISDQPGQFP